MLHLDNILSTVCLHSAAPFFSSSLLNPSLYLFLPSHFSRLPLFRLSPVPLRNNTKIPATLCKHTILSAGMLSLCLSLKQTQQCLGEKKHLLPFLYTLLETTLLVAHGVISMNSSSLFFLNPTCFLIVSLHFKIWHRAISTPKTPMPQNTQPPQLSLEARPTISHATPTGCSARPSLPTGDPHPHPCPGAQGLHFSSAWGTQCWLQRRSGSSRPGAALGGGRGCPQHGQGSVLPKQGAVLQLLFCF